MFLTERIMPLFPTICPKIVTRRQPLEVLVAQGVCGERKGLKGNTELSFHLFPTLEKKVHFQW